MIEKLKGVQYKKRQLERLQKKLQNLESGYVADVVRDYRFSPKGIPVVIAGYDSLKIADLKKEYAEMVETLMDEINHAENAILSVPDERDRLVLQMRFIDGMKIGEIAMEMECSDRTINTILKRYR